MIYLKSHFFLDPIFSPFQLTSGTKPSFLDFWFIYTALLSKQKISGDVFTFLFRKKWVYFLPIRQMKKLRHNRQAKGDPNKPQERKWTQAINHQTICSFFYNTLAFLLPILLSKPIQIHLPKNTNWEPREVGKDRHPLGPSDRRQRCVVSLEWGVDAFSPFLLI